MYLLFDIGGSKTRVAVSEDLETFVGEPVLFETAVHFSDQVDRVANAAHTLLNGATPTAMAGGLKGAFNRRTGYTITVPGKDTWNNQPFVALVEKALGVTPLVINDTSIVGLGEAHRGAGKGSHILAYMSISTGIGGARLVDGVIDDSQIGFEPGHQIIDHVSLSRLEALVGGAALEARMLKHPIEITDPAIWEEEARILSIGIHNTILHWSPDTVVLGGSMMQGIGVRGILIESLIKHIQNLRQIFPIFPEIPSIRLAELGHFGGLYGAMVALKRAQ
jgi:predicted NBD/HSP70 family sugar kinase